MMGAVDQARALVQEGICRPVQGDAPVRAAVAVEVHLALAAHAEQVDAVYAEGAAVALGQRSGSTKEVNCKEGS